uniref:Uncharacterized protein n=1 Tax=Zooxanthella nutricula TaxID=1333877 RepID=A0A7S2QJD5_9DINO
MPGTRSAAMRASLTALLMLGVVSGARLQTIERSRGVVAAHASAALLDEQTMAKDSADAALFFVSHLRDSWQFFKDAQLLSSKTSALKHIDDDIKKLQACVSKAEGLIPEEHRHLIDKDNGPTEAVTPNLSEKIAHRARLHSQRWRKFKTESWEARALSLVAIRQFLDAERGLFSQAESLIAEEQCT